MPNKFNIYNTEPLSYPLPHELIRRIARKIMKDYSVPAYEINLICMDRDELRAMKKEYFGIDRFTDVITFPLSEGREFLEGEIYISPEDIRINAREFHTAEPEEAARILIHGLLHLLGYDDIEAEDKEEMTELENKYLGLFPQ